MKLISEINEAYKALPRGRVSDIPHNLFHIGAGLTGAIVDEAVTFGLVPETEDVKD